MRFGLFGSAQARRSGPDTDSSQGFREFIDNNVEAEALGYYSTFLVEQEVVPAGGDLADALGVARALPERRVWLLVGRRLHDDVVELSVFAVERETFVRDPGLRDDVDGFLEPSAAFFHRNAEAGEFVVAVAFADAEIEPSAGQQI